MDGHDEAERRILQLLLRHCLKIMISFIFLILANSSILVLVVELVYYCF